jgi:hypothetical protein
VSTTGFAIFAALGVAIIIALSIWASRLLYQLKQQQRQLRDNDAPSQAQNQARNSIVVLAKGALSEQVDITEAAIRIATLLDYLAIDDVARARFTHVYQLSAATAHIPRLEQWQQLSKAQRRDYRREKEQLEQQHSDPLRRNLEQLVVRYS